MQFFRDLLDPTIASENTPVSTFKLNYEMAQADYEEMIAARKERSTAFYYKRSTQYYNIKLNATAQDGNRSDAQLPITIVKGQAFSLHAHAVIVADHTRLYQEKYKALFNLDLKIVGSIVLAIIAANTPFIPFVGLVSMIAWAAALYFISQRADLYNDYKDSLTLLITTCNWALGSSSHSDNPQSLAKAPEIRGMLDSLFSVLTKKQVKHLIDDAIEKNFVEALESYDSRFKFPLVSRMFSTNNRAAQIIDKELENTALKQRGADVLRSIYGPNRGTTKDFALLIFPLILDILRAGYNAGKAYFTPAEQTAPTKHM